MTDRTTTKKRRDQVKPGDVVRSSHGYDLLITTVLDDAPRRRDDRHVELIGHLHGDRKNALRNERYPAGSLVEVYVPVTMRPAEPYLGSIGDRKKLRGSIRNKLGTSHEAAPTPLGTLSAAREMARLLDLTTSSRYGLAVFDFRTGEHRPLDSVIQEEREAYEAAKSR